MPFAGAESYDSIDIKQTAMDFGIRGMHAPARGAARLLPRREAPGA